MDATEKWNRIALGESSDGTPATWDVEESPHLFLNAGADDRKTLLQKSVIIHAVQYFDKWDLIGLSLKKSDVISHEETDGAMKIGRTLEEWVEILSSVVESMRNSNSSPHDKSTLIIVDGILYLLPRGDEDEEDYLRREASNLIFTIAREGRASGVHLFIDAQKIEPKVISDELNSNLTTRVTLGHLDTMTFQETVGNNVDSTPHEGFMFQNGEGTEFNPYGYHNR